MCQILNDYEEKSKSQQTLKILQNEEIPSAQKRFHEEASNFTRCNDELGNPFTEESSELIALDAKTVSISQYLYSFERRGDEQFESFKNN